MGIRITVLLEWFVWWNGSDPVPDALQVIKPSLCNKVIIIIHTHTHSVGVQLKLYATLVSQSVCDFGL